MESIEKAVKFEADCNKLRKDSLSCLSTHNGDKRACVDFFTAYRDCRKEAHNAKIEERRRRMNGG